MGCIRSSPGMSSARAGPMKSSPATMARTRPSERAMSASAPPARRDGATSALLMSYIVPQWVSVPRADLLHLVEHAHALVDRVEEVRRHPDAAARPVVDDEPPLDELVVHAFGVAGVDRHVPAAPARLLRRPHGEAPVERAVQQRLRQ